LLCNNKIYVYETFGKIYTISGRNDFPMHIMYKGYYYDEETKLYYCMSRYYSPEFRRFIGPDKCNYLEAEEPNGLNLYCYCNNDPVNNYDPTGHLAISTIIGIVVGVVALLATAHDIYALVSKDVNIDKDYTNSNNVRIHNSYKILTPWVRYCYSFYLNHINPNTKDVIQGSTAVVQFEWELHNYAAWLGIKGESTRNLDVGKSIFADGNSHLIRDEEGNLTLEGVMSVAMRLMYIFSGNPIFWIWDLIVNGGF